MTSTRAERIAWVVLLAVALTLRLVVLGDRPVHHDESQHGYFAWLLLRSGDYSYQPLLHGPVDFFSIALSFSVFGDGEFTLRLPHALTGSALCLTPLLLRRELGRPGALAAGIALCTSPSLLYYSRFAREDIIAVALTAIALAALIRLGQEPRRRHAIALLAALALAFATKETTFITVFALAVAVGCTVALQRRRGVSVRATWPIRGVLSLGGEPWRVGAAVFLVLITLLFSNGLTNPPGLTAAFADGLRYWLDQHGVGRGGQPASFYLVVLALYEPVIVALALVGAVARRREPFVVFLAVYTVVTLAVYTWAGEKFGWLVLHPLLPCALLAGVGADAIWRARAALPARMAVAAAALLACATFAVALRASFEGRGADPRELFISPQTSVASADAIRAIAARDHGPARLRFAIDSAIEWPWTWYLRGRDVRYVDASVPRAVTSADVALLFDPAAARLDGALTGFDRRMVAFRRWWVVDYSRATARSVARWELGRHPWSATGGDRLWIYDRRQARRR